MIEGGILRSASLTGNCGKGRRAEVDCLRALGAWFVVVYHFGVFGINLSNVGFCTTYVRSFLSCCVPIFFFLTGVLYANKSLSFEKGLKKALKLLLLSLVWSALLWPIRALQNGIDLSLNHYVSGVLTFQHPLLTHLWFLPALAIVYLVIPFFCSVKEKDDLLFSHVVFCICVIVFGVSLFEASSDFLGAIFGTQIFSKAVGFLNRFNPLRGIHAFSIAFCLLGMWWERRKPKLSTRLVGVSVAIAPVLLAAYSILIMKGTGEKYDSTWNGYSSLCALVVTIGLYEVVSRMNARGGVGQLVAFVGTNSFGVYLLHQLFLPMYRLFASGIGSSILATLAGLLFCLCVVVFLAFVNMWLCRTRVGKWLLSI